jgi:hypothetical protein
MTYSGLHYDELRKQQQLESWQESEEQNVPLGHGLANAVEGSIQRGVGWLQEQAEDDPDKWTDDALRLMGGGLKNISKIPGMGLIGKVGEAGGHVGAGIAEMMGVDRRIGGFVGSMAADAALGAGVGKVARIGKTAHRINRLNRAGHGLQVDHVMRAAKGQPYGFAFGDAGELAVKKRGLLDAAGTTDKGHKTIKRLSDELKPKLSKGIKNYIGNTSDELGLEWVKKGGGLDQALEDLLKVKRGPDKGRIRDITELSKDDLDNYKSLLATGPAKDPSDVIVYGTKKNVLADTANMNHPDYVPSFHKSKEFHHKGMKALQYGIHKRARDLRNAGAATDDELLNLHKMGEALGIESGSRQGAGLWMHRTPHQVLHQDIMLKRGIQPKASVWSNKPVKNPPKEFKAIGAVNRYDIEWIKNLAGKKVKGKYQNWNEAVARWREYKNSPMYKFLAPDGESEISRMILNMEDMDIAQLTRYQKEIFEDISIPMTKEAKLLERTMERLTNIEKLQLTPKKQLKLRRMVKDQEATTKFRQDERLIPREWKMERPDFNEMDYSPETVIY